jgi:hypothetical protein
MSVSASVEGGAPSPPSLPNCTRDSLATAVTERCPPYRGPYDPN